MSSLILIYFCKFLNECFGICVDGGERVCVWLYLRVLSKILFFSCLFFPPLSLLRILFSQNLLILFED